MSKGELRQLALRSRRSVAPESLAALSSEVQRLFLELPEFQRAETVAAYASKEDEVETRGIIGAALAGRKRVAVPRVDQGSATLSFRLIESLIQLSPGSFGVPEPPAELRSVTLEECDIVAVPVVAWDESGNRLGYGRGYFDKALKSRGRAFAAGLALEAQRYPDIPQGPSDVPLDAIVTERRVVRVEASHR